MRRVAIIVPLFLVMACSREPDFDEQYENAEKQIRDKAEEIDRELEARGSQAAAPDGGETGPAPSAAPPSAAD